MICPNKDCEMELKMDFFQDSELLGSETVGICCSSCCERIYQCEACFTLKTLEQELSQKFTDSQPFDTDQFGYVYFCSCGYPNIIDKVYREKFGLNPFHHPGYSLSLQNMLLILGKNGQDYSNHIHAELLQMKRRWAGKHVSTSMVHKFISDSLKISHIFPSKRKKLHPSTAVPKCYSNVDDLDLNEMKRYYLLCSLMQIIVNAEDRLYALKHNLIKCEFSKSEVEKLVVLFADPNARQKCILIFAQGITEQLRVANASIGYIASQSLKSCYTSSNSHSQVYLKKICNYRLLKQKNIEESILGNLEYIRQEICVTLGLLGKIESHQLLPYPSVALKMLQKIPDIKADSSIKRARVEADMDRRNRSELLDKLDLLLRLYRYARQ